jgi:hypothetical protein
MVCNGITDTEAGDDQCCAASNTKDTHEETLLIADQISDRYFPGKGQMIPDERHFFNQCGSSLVLGTLDASAVQILPSYLRDMHTMLLQA